MTPTLTKEQVKSKTRKMVRLLREECPPILPVRVYFRDMTKKTSFYNAFAELKFGADDRPHHFIIVLDENMDWQAMWQTLLHEWAHVISWTSESDTVCDHDPEWGIAMSRIYQEIMEP